MPELYHYFKDMTFDQQNSLNKILSSMFVALFKGHAVCAVACPVVGHESASQLALFSMILLCAKAADASNHYRHSVLEREGGQRSSRL